MTPIEIALTILFFAGIITITVSGLSVENAIKEQTYRTQDNYPFFFSVNTGLVLGIALITAPTCIAILTATEDLREIIRLGILVPTIALIIMTVLGWVRFNINRVQKPGDYR